MATNVGRLSVDFIAKTAKFQKGIKAAQKRTTEFTTELGRIAKRGIAIGIGVATGAITAMGYAARQAAKDIDAMTKTAQKLGLLPGELQELRLAAELAGVETNKLEMGVQRMVRRIAEAANGTGEAKDAIAALGLNAKQLASLAPQEQFKTIARAMGQLNNQSERVLFAFKLFDSEGVDLVRMMQNGGQAIDEAGKFLDQFGLRLNAIDTTKVEMMNDSVHLLAQLFKGVAQQVAVNVAPSIIHLTKQTLEWAKTSGGVGKIVFDVFQKIAEGIDAIANRFDKMKRGLAEFTITVNEQGLKAYKRQLNRLGPDDHVLRGKILARVREAHDAIAAARGTVLGPEREQDKAVKWLDDVKNRVDGIAAKMAESKFELAGGNDPTALLEQFKKAQELASQIAADEGKAKRGGMGREVELAFTALGGAGAVDPAMRVQQEQLRVEKRQAELLEQILRQGGGAVLQ